MIENILGNKTLEKILLSIEKDGDCYANGVAKKFKLPLFAVQNQLKKMEKTGVLKSRIYANVRIYEFNPKYPLLNELRALLQKTNELINKKKK